MTTHTTKTTESANTTEACLIHTVAAVIRNDRGQVLLVRKQTSRCYIQPGGKPEPDEEPVAALARELEEELGVVLRSAAFMGQFEDQAVHESGHRVRAQVYLTDINGIPQPQAEIAELRWVDNNDLNDEAIAPLSRKHILPLVLNRKV